MARYTDSQCRVCRREGQKLFLKGDRCYSDKCSFAKRPTPPGQHGATAKRGGASNYGTQLREKQKVRRIYGVLEGQYKRCFAQAEKMPGMAGENFLSLLERRLDNVVFRMGFANSRNQARQLVNHGHFMVNGHKVDIPSYIIAVGDTVSVRERSASGAFFTSIKEGAKKTTPAWVAVDYEKLEGKVVTAPKREDIDFDVQENLIVEWYSK